MRQKELKEGDGELLLLREDEVREGGSIRGRIKDQVPGHLGGHNWRRKGDQRVGARS